MNDRKIKKHHRSSDSWLKKKLNIRSLLPYIPEPLRDKMIRQRLNLQYALPAEFKIELVQSLEDMEAAFRLLHDAYVDAGYMKPHLSGMRILPQHMLTTTTMMVVKMGKEVIGTASIIRDNPLGLPMESIYDLGPLRRAQQRLGETSSMALKKEYRRDRGLFTFPLLKYLLNYMQHYGLTDCLVTAVNPTMSDLYRAVFMAEMLPAPLVQDYAFVNGAPSIGEFIDVNSVDRKMAQVFAGQPLERNMHQFMQPGAIPNLKFPERSFYKGFDSILTPEAIQEFFIKAGVFANTPDEVRLKILNFYSGSAQAEVFAQAEKKIIAIKQRKEFRYATKCPAIVQNQNQNQDLAAPAEVIEVSGAGLVIRGASSVNLNQELKIHLATGPGKVAEVTGQQVWSRNGGIGIQIQDHCKGWQSYLTHLDQATGTQVPAQRAA